MKYKMLTGASTEEIMSTNSFVFFNLIGASEPVVAEDSLRMMKIVDNKMLLKSKETFNKYSELYDQQRQSFEKGVKTYHTSADFSKLLELKNMLGGA